MQHSENRNTKQRKLILKTLSSSKTPLTANEIYGVIIDQGNSIAKSTIYRNLETLLENDQIYRGQFEDGENYYRAVCEHHHHHYMICKKCNKMIDLPECPLTEWDKKLSEKFNFEITDHIVELYGFCSACKIKL